MNGSLWRPRSVGKSVAALGEFVFEMTSAAAAAVSSPLSRWPRLQSPIACLVTRRAKRVPLSLHLRIETVMEIIFRQRFSLSLLSPLERQSVQLSLLQIGGAFSPSNFRLGIGGLASCHIHTRTEGTRTKPLLSTVAMCDCQFL